MGWGLYDMYVRVHLKETLPVMSEDERIWCSWPLFISIGENVYNERYAFDERGLIVVS